MVKGADGLFYIPSAFIDMIRVMKEDPSSHTLEEVDVIKIGMPVDNLSVDEQGDIYAAGFPKMLDLLASLQDPYNIYPPSTIFRIRKSLDEGRPRYIVTKVLEDRDTVAMGGVTTALHDVKSGRLFMGGMYIFWNIYYLFAFVSLTFLQVLQLPISLCVSLNRRLYSFVE